MDNSNQLTAPEDNISPILSMVKDTGSTDLLTPDELATYSMYVDEAYQVVSNTKHNTNLAASINQTYLNRLATDIIEWTETDLESRRDWEKKEARGIRMLGVSTKTIAGAKFKGASKVVHPMLIEAIVQFQARAIAEMWPSTGPVKTVVMGDPTDEGVQQAERVEGYMNYQYTELMPGAFEEEDKLLFRLPISGSCFKKLVYDPLEGNLVSRFIEPSNFIVPYSANDLQSAIRYTERFEECGNDTLKKISGGVYVDVNLLDAQETIAEDSVVQQEIDATEGINLVDYEEAQDYLRYETYCYLDIPGHEDVDKSGKQTGVKLPYVVTTDKDNQKILSIRRNWEEGDLKKRKRVYHIHYKFLPGLGFYGYGLLHTIGGLGESATGALRALLDAAGFANNKGGYRSADAKVQGGDTPIGMGEWKEVDLPMEELEKAFYTLPYDEPSKALIELLGMIEELGQRFASTTENMVGEASNTGPVGTTLALIEQGSKVFSGIHLRLHKAHEREFKLLATLNAEYVEEEYPYNVPGESRTVMQADFDDRVDVIPVSDPNTISNTQRIARSQAALDLAERQPDLYNLREAHTAMLEALRVPNIAELLPPEDEMEPVDPVSENASMMQGHPIKAFMEQDHEAHMAVHGAFFMTLGEEDQKRLLPVFAAHMAEHKAMDYILHMESIMGVSIDQIPPGEAAQAAAQASQIYVGEVGIPDDGEAQEPDPMVAAAQEEKRKDMQAMAGIKRNDMESVATMRRQDDQAAAEIERMAGKEINQAIAEENAAKKQLEETPGQ